MTAEPASSSRMSGEASAAMPDLVVEATGVEKWFGRLHVLKGLSLDGQAARSGRHDRPFGLGQDDLHQVHQPPREDPGRADPCERTPHRIPGGRWPARRGQGAKHRPPAPGDRDGLPALQPVPAHDCPREHRRGPDPGPRDLGGRSDRDGPRAARPRRPDRQGGLLPGPAVRRPAAAGRDRPGPGDEARAHALRRADQRPRPGDDRRGPRSDEGARPRGDDDDRRQPRDGLRPRGRRPGRDDGRRGDHRGRHARALLHEPATGTDEELPLEDLSERR